MNTESLDLRSAEMFREAYNTYERLLKDAGFDPDIMKRLNELENMSNVEIDKPFSFTISNTTKE
jgi:hypothetical protein